MKKKCYRCKKNKDLKEFSKNASRKDGLSHQCKLCHSELRKEHYLKNKSKILEQVSEYKKKIRQFIIDYKTGKKCQDCKKEYPYYVLDFDHIEGKRFDISAAPNKHGMNGLIEEIKKCELVCANCHRIRTHNRLERD